MEIWMIQGYSNLQKVFIKEHVRQKNLNKFSTPTILDTINLDRQTFSTENPT